MTTHTNTKKGGAKQHHQLKRVSKAGAITHAKIHYSKDIEKICAYFRYKTATTLEAAKNTGILRNSITWYVDTLTKLGLLQIVTVKPDKQTGRLANWYSANPDLWGMMEQPKRVQRKRRYKELDLFSWRNHK